MAARGALVKGLLRVPQACSFILSRAMSSRLFVGGLSFTTEEDGLRNAFSKHGEVVDARIVTDRESGRSRGFGFVTFLTEADAETAKDKMNGQFLDGRVIRVDRATPRPAPPLPPPRPQEEQSSAQDWGTIPSPIAAVPQNAGLVQGPETAAELPSLSSLASSMAPPPPISGSVPPPASSPSPPLPPPIPSAPPPAEPAKPSFSFNFDFSTPDPSYLPRSRPARLRPSMMDYEFGLFSDTSKFPFNTNFGTGFLRVRGPEAEFDFSDIKEALALKKAAELAAKKEAEAAAAAAMAEKEAEEAYAKQAQEAVVATPTPSSQGALAAATAKEVEVAATKQAQEGVMATTLSSQAGGESSISLGAMETSHTPQKQEVAVEEKDSRPASLVAEAAGPEATDMQQKHITAAVEELVEAVSMPETPSILQEQKAVAGDNEPKQAILTCEDNTTPRMQAASVSGVSASGSLATDIFQKQVAGIGRASQEAPHVDGPLISHGPAPEDVSPSLPIPVIESVAIVGATDTPGKQEVAVFENQSRETPPVVASSGTPNDCAAVLLQNQEMLLVEMESQEVPPVVTISDNEANETKTALSSNSGTFFSVSGSATEISRKQEVEVVDEETGSVVTSSLTLNHSPADLSRNQEAGLSEQESHGVPPSETACANNSRTGLSSSSVEMLVVEKKSQEVSPVVTIPANEANKTKTGISSNPGTFCSVSGSATEASKKQEIEVVDEETGSVVTPSSILKHSQADLSWNQEVGLSEQESHGVPQSVTSCANNSQTGLLSSSVTLSIVSAAVPEAENMPRRQEAAVVEKEFQESTIDASGTHNLSQTDISSQHLGLPDPSLETSHTASSDSSLPAETEVPQLRQVVL